MTHYRAPVSSRKVRKPQALQRGDLIGVVAPGAAIDRAALERGVGSLEAAGFKVKLGASVLRREGYLAGSDGERAADFRAIYGDPEVKAVIAARGGYGCGRLLSPTPLLGAGDPAKLFIGHSDVTFLLADILQRGGMVSVHGPLVANLQPGLPVLDSLVDFITADPESWRHQGARTIRTGRASGILTGGCLSIVTAMLGTPYAIDVAGSILFLEEVNEKPFRIDRMLTQLRQAGVLDSVAGVVFGEMVGCSATPNEAVTVADVIADIFRDAPYPVTFGVPSGHGRGTSILPFGIRAELEDDRLTLLESPFA